MKNKIFFADMNKKTVIFFIALLVGAALILVAPSFAEKRSIKSSENELERYINETEARLKNTVSAIKGAGKTEVFISVENTFETVYASNASIDESGDEASKSKTTQKELAYSTSKDMGEVPVVVKQICPEISGVLVVCEGGSEKIIRNEIINAVSTAVGIPTSKIYVTGGND